MAAFAVKCEPMQTARNSNIVTEVTITETVTKLFNETLKKTWNFNASDCSNDVSTLLIISATFGKSLNLNEAVKTFPVTFISEVMK